MAYLIGSLVGSAVGHVISNELHNNRAQADTARLNSPIGRLGRCGIATIRLAIAEEAVVGQLFAACDDNWLVMAGARLGQRPLPPVAVGGDWAVVVQPVVGEDHVTAVRLADEAARMLVEHVRPEPLAVTRVVCWTEGDQEPRDVPGPSGVPVTITGEAWLAGLLRQRIGDVPEWATVPDALVEPAQAALWRWQQRRALKWDAVNRLPAQHWWSIGGLLLDDGIGGPIDLVLAGPTGLFAVELSKTGADDCITRVAMHTQRLRSYLPYSDAVPVIVSETVTKPRFGPSDSAGNPIAWLRPKDLLGFALNTRRRGVGPAELDVLNRPGQGWYRSVRPDTDGTAKVSIGWMV